MKYIINVNETSFFHFLWLCLKRRDVYFLAVDPWFPPFRRFCQRAVDWAVTSGRARDVMELCPEHKHLRERWITIALFNIFVKIEPGIDEYFDFERADRVLPLYAMAYKKVVWNYIRPKKLDVLILKSALPRLEEKDVRVLGVYPSIVNAAENYAKQSFGPVVKPVGTGLFPVVNAFFSVGILAYSIGWVLSRIRPFAAKPEPVFVAADYIKDERDHRVYNELKDGGTILLVPRHSDTNPENSPVLKEYRWCRPTGGHFKMLGALEALKDVIADQVRLFFYFRQVEPGVFYQVATLPYRRVVIRALFNRFRPKFYWCRDEYNVEHILRRQELNKAGGLAYGISHGIEAEKNIASSWRYISFDRYYIFGNVFYEIHKDTWDKNMTVSVVGSFTPSREDYAFIGKPRPKDIVVFTGICALEPRLAEAVREIAKGFPDRKIWLQIKPAFAKLPRGKNLIETCTRDLPNVHYTDDGVFEILRRVSYAFSDPSTVVIEAMQFGITSFLLDISNIHDECIYREYPGLCLKSGEEAVRTIRNIENGSWQYPRESYTDLADLSGRVIFDVIREDMGLAKAEPPAEARF